LWQAFIFFTHKCIFFRHNLVNLKKPWYKVTSGLGILGGNESFEQEQQRQL